MMLDYRDEYASDWAALTLVASKFVMAPETLRTSVRRAQVDGGLRPGLTTGCSISHDRCSMPFLV